MGPQVLGAMLPWVRGSMGPRVPLVLRATARGRWQQHTDLARKVKASTMTWIIFSLLALRLTESSTAAQDAPLGAGPPAHPGEMGLGVGGGLGCAWGVVQPGNSTAPLVPGTHLYHGAGSSFADLPRSSREACGLSAVASGQPLPCLRPWASPSLSACGVEPVSAVTHGCWLWAVCRKGLTSAWLLESVGGAVAETFQPAATPWGAGLDSCIPRGRAAPPVALHLPPSPSRLTAVPQEEQMPLRASACTHPVTPCPAWTSASLGFPVSLRLLVMTAPPASFSPWTLQESPHFADRGTPGNQEGKGPFSR